MNIHFFFSPLLHSISTISIFILVVLPKSFCHVNVQFLECNKTFNCGTIQGIGYPFWGSLRPRYCGHEGFELICEENHFPLIKINAQRFHVLNLSQPVDMMRIAPVGIWEDPCPQQFHNISLNHNLFDFAATIRNLTIFYGCPFEDEIPPESRFDCSTSGSNGNSHAYYLDESLLRNHRSELTDCSISITFPVNQGEFDELWSGRDNIVDARNKGFDVMYHKDMIPCMVCKNSGGVCGSNETSLEFLCFCRDQPYSKTCLASDIWEDPCPQQFHNISLNHSLFDFAATIRNLTIFYGCPFEDEIPSENRFDCCTSGSNGNSHAYYLDESLLRNHRSELTDCSISITVPVNQGEFDELWSGTDKIADARNKRFDVMYHKDMIPCMVCRNSGGVCGSNETSFEFLCFCRDQPYVCLFL